MSPLMAQGYDWTTLAGWPGWGYVDGDVSIAKFNEPVGIAVDGVGNIYVAEVGNNVIRKITPGGVVSTLAGTAGLAGSTDGPSGGASFNSPKGVAVDGDGNVYVADTSNQTIRKITPAGMVSTLAGMSGAGGSADGTGGNARFADPWGVAVDGAGNVYVADFYNCTIRKITAAGVVSTLAGTVGTSGNTDGMGSAARFNYPEGLAADVAGNVFVSDTHNHSIRKITPDGTVTTLAGTGTPGSTDGTGIARFSFPSA